MYKGAFFLPQFVVKSQDFFEWREKESAGVLKIMRDKPGRFP